MEGAPSTPSAFKVGPSTRLSAMEVGRGRGLLRQRARLEGMRGRAGAGRRGPGPLRAAGGDSGGGGGVRGVMAEGLRAGGLAPGLGRRVKWGVLSEDVGAVDAGEEAEAVRAEIRAEAAADLVNIDAEERGRRGQVGAAALALSGLLAAGLWASGAPGFLRFAFFYPTFSAGVGFAASARLGL